MDITALKNKVAYNKDNRKLYENDKAEYCGD